MLFIHFHNQKNIVFELLNLWKMINFTIMNKNKRKNEKKLFFISQLYDRMLLQNGLEALFKLF